MVNLIELKTPARMLREELRLDTFGLCELEKVISFHQAKKADDAFALEIMAAAWVEMLLRHGKALAQAYTAIFIRDVTHERPSSSATLGLQRGSQVSSRAAELRYDVKEVLDHRGEKIPTA